jgi:ribosomal protein L37AE/L43A
MKGSSLRSRPGSFICPFCETDQLVSLGHDFFHCASCGGLLSGAMVETLQQIRRLPEGLGCQACECGHPEMRRLPDGVFHCPACGSEVMPLEASNEPTSQEYRSQAYWCGWIDGRFAETGCFTENLNLARCSAPSDRLDYYRGHRAGREEARLAASTTVGFVWEPSEELATQCEINASKGDEKRR